MFLHITVTAHLSRHVLRSFQPLTLLTHTHRRVTALALIKEHTCHRLGFQCSVLTVKQPARPASYRVCFTTLSLISLKPGNLGWWAFYWSDSVVVFQSVVFHRFLHKFYDHAKAKCCAASLSCLLSLSLTSMNDSSSSDMTSSSL